MTAATPRRRRRPPASAGALKAGALLASSSTGKVAGELRHLQLDAIDAELNPNPRGEVDTTSDSFLAFLDSVRASGVLQPVGAHPHPDDPERVALTMGWRRYTAATIAELDTIPVYVTALTGSALVRAIAENSAREDLSPLQEAHAIQTLMDDEGLNQVEAGKLIGRSERTVRNRLQLLKLPPQVAAAIDAGEVPANAARALEEIGQAEPERAKALVDQVRAGALTGEQVVAERDTAAESRFGRRAEALALVSQRPGITIPEIAEQMGVKQSYLYRVLPALEHDGQVIKQGRGWHPAAQGPASPDAAAERDHWIRLFNRLEGAVAQHKNATTEFREVHDEALYAAHERVLRDAGLSPTAAQINQTGGA